MVLNDLGKKINGALRKMTNLTIIDDEAVDAMLKEISRALLEADVNVKTVAQLRGNVKKSVNLDELAAGHNKRRMIQKAVFDELCKMLDSGRKPVVLKKGKPNVVMFVGLQGNGKTTSCVKYAYYHQRKGWKTCVVCADTFRAGAFDQLRQNCLKAKIPYYGSYSETDPVKIAMDGVERFRIEKYELIVVDTSGRHKQEAALFEEMEQMAAAIEPNDVVFVMDSSIGQAAHDHALAFRQRVDVGSVIITKLDGHAKGGGALSAVSATQSPITFIGVGEHIDEFEPFSTQNFVGRLLGLGDVSGLVTTIKEAGLHDNQKLYENITHGVFTLRDLYDQFQALTKLGPLGQLMSMMPGMSEMMPAGGEREGKAKIQKFLTMMDSMTDKELDDAKAQFSESRMYRIARGSGRSLQDVNELIHEHKRFAKLVGKLGKMKGMKTGNAKDLENMPQQLSRIMDPRMLQQLGGAGGVQNLMRQLAKNMPGEFGGK
uniref:Signal recognition particle 54 kDa protein n=1 Tax=Compsopogon caeruleus TaxID=31354 RepID=A0A7S1XFD6_9RHOD|mmetsp:Transcript_6062/g.11868  ORF Transcript_6062/g.11868 Transcript_6062/m.11868 type:complete len:487 (+) Transcript_6062:118-1578(+)|eukprot:CAMPEP_0184685132 /NCGR_PEP_ID=MMETSP0312-20130426/17793_1 /TAXON_ID=31354 /ORGANISM="Compsopogon coeruleus, Strain SAG 36.94" /LENGTH=486 /DNA_ID=CAMNT_0027138927 /DNA_START=45 /DNA_END=1505 /DNA_ORIENTATION=-